MLDGLLISVAYGVLANFVFSWLQSTIRREVRRRRSANREKCQLLTYDSKPNSPEVD